MKAFYTLILLVFLASCGSETVTEDSAMQTPDVVQETVVEIDDSVEALPDTEEVNTDSSPSTGVESIEDEVVEEEATEEQAEEVVELSTTYNNPKMEVIMDIEYNVDSEGKITEISLTSPNYDDMPKWNDRVQ